MKAVRQICLLCGLLGLSTGCLIKTVKPISSRTLTAQEASERTPRPSKSEDGDKNSLEQSRTKILEGDLEREPGNPKWYFELGYVYEQNGNFERAEQLYKDGRKLVGPGYTGPDLFLGRLLIKRGRLDEGLQALKRILALEPTAPQVAIRNPHFQEAHFLVGVCYFLKNNREASKDAFRSYLRLGGSTDAVIRYFPSLVAG